MVVYLQQASKEPQVVRYRRIHHLFISRSEPDETSKSRARTGHCSTSWFATARGAFDVAASVLKPQKGKMILES